MEIRCKKGDCEHNTGCSCDAKNIHIDCDNAACDTYTKDEVKENIIIENGNIFDVANDMAAKNTNNVPLKCDAKNCLYNHSEKCVANGITVIDNESSNCNADAACATFVAK